MMLTLIRERLKGWKTIVWSRFLVTFGVVTGILVPLLGSITTDQNGTIIPASRAPFAPTILVLIGVINEWLRRITTGPVGAKGDEAPPPETKAGD